MKTSSKLGSSVEMSLISSEVPILERIAPEVVVAVA